MRNIQFIGRNAIIKIDTGVWYFTDINLILTSVEDA